jgi:hypothetical protein
MDADRSDVRRARFTSIYHMGRGESLKGHSPAVVARIDTNSSPLDISEVPDKFLDEVCRVQMGVTLDSGLSLTSRGIFVFP